MFPIFIVFNELFPRRLFRIKKVIKLFLMEPNSKRNFSLFLQNKNLKFFFEILISQNLII